MSKTNEFIETIEEELTPDQVDQLLYGGQGDTDDESEESMPGALASDGDDKSKVDATNDGEDALTADNAVLMARDGKHTIPFEKLAEARDGERRWREQAEAAQQELERMQHESQARADAGVAPTVQDNQIAAAENAIAAGVDPDIFGDFSEEALARGIETLVKQQVEARLSSALAPFEQREAESKTNDHYNAIYEAHPDADSIAQSQQLIDWIGSQPTFVRGSLNAVLEKGDTAQVIELLDAFKAAGGGTQAATTTDALRSAANRAIAGAKHDVPASLSDFPSGRAGANSRAEAMAGMDGADLMEAMDNLSPEQIEQYLNRL